MTSEPPSVFDAASAQLGRLFARGAAPERVTAELGSTIAGWADEPDMTPEVMQARVQALWDGVTRDAAALQEQIGDAGKAGWVQQARRTLAAMEAAVEALGAVLGRA